MYKPNGLWFEMRANMVSEIEAYLLIYKVVALHY